jgi:hypothetical protein
VGTSEAFIASTAPLITAVDLDKKIFNIQVKTEITSASDISGKISYSVKGVKSVSQVVQLKPGDNLVTYEFQVENVDLWYQNLLIFD